MQASAGLVEDARYLFVDEAPVAYDYAVAQARADALVEAAEGRPGSEQGAALIEAEPPATAALISRALRSGRRTWSPPADSLLEEHYWVEDHFHVGQRLLRPLPVGAGGAGPESGGAAGDRYALAALLVSVAPVPVAAGLLWRRSLGRRPRSRAGSRTAESW